MIIGLTGPNAAGKGAVAEMLSRRGYTVHSLSDVVREAARSRGLGVDRDTLIRLGQEMRGASGPAVLAEEILGRLGPAGAAIAIDSIRHPAEVAVLRRRSDFRLLGVDAAMELRWRRAQTRGRPGDDAGLDVFRANEGRENTRRPDSQQLLATLALADRVLMNDGTLEQLESELSTALSAWQARDGASAVGHAQTDRSPNVRKD